jgi:hypothetical protein
MNKVKYTAIIDKACNRCGKELDLFDMQNNFVLHEYVGYGSRHDEEEIHLRLCNDCFDALADQCAITPTVRYMER